MAPRRERGSILQAAQVRVTIEADVKDKFDKVAAKCGLSGAQFFEELVKNLELTDQGIPTWWTPLPRDGELPIDSR